MKNRIKILLVLSTTMLSACSIPERQVNYVSPLEFQSYNCRQIGSEMSVVSSQIETINRQNATTQMLDAGLQAFAMSQNHAYISGNNGNTEEIERLKSKYEALHKASVQKNCV